MNFERVEYYCIECHQKGTIEEVLVHPTTLLLRGSCASCGIRSAIRAIDLIKLAQHISETEPLPSEKSAWHEANYVMSLLARN